MSKNIRALSARLIKDKTLFEALNETAGNTGSLSHKQLSDISDERLLPPGVLLGTISFYDFLKPDNSGKRAYVCNGTCCMLSGKQEAARSKLSKRFSADEIGEATCLGHCYKGGAFWEENTTYDEGSGSGSESASIPFYSKAPRSLYANEITDVNHFYQVALLEQNKILEELSRSYLRGRGGAGFLFADKLAACTQASVTQGGEKYVVCNGDEGDPGAFSDRYLLEQQPHRVLAGMLAAGLVAGAKTGFVYIRAEYPAAQTRMAEAIDAFEKTTVHMQTGFQFRIVRGAGSYICGEETALLNSIEGLRPEVRTRPPYPAQEGLFGQPTLLSNVETFAAIPWILEHGGADFAAIGTEESAGTKLLSLDYNFNIPGVHEVEMGVPLETVIYEYGGGFRSPVKALQIGGPLGSVLPMDKIAALSLDYESFSQEGFLLGHASIVTIPQSFPMIDFLRHLFSFMAEESCGKCLPCRLGTSKGHMMLEKASRDSPIDNVVFDDLLETLELGSLCGLGSGLPLPVHNILTYFSAELSDYFDKEITAP